MANGVLLDATPLASAHALRGIGAALDGLLSGFLALDESERPHLLADARRPTPAGFSRTDVRRPRWRGYRLPDPWPRTVGERIAGRRKEALFHATQPALIPPGPGVVVTLYDLIPAVYPDHYLAGAGRVAERRLYHHYLERVSGADAVIAISRETAGDARRLLDIPEERIHVVPLACPELAPADGDVPTAPFALYYGGLEPHKNAGLAIEAIAACRPGTRLAMCGAWSRRRMRRLMRKARRLGAGERIDWFGHLPPGRLSALRDGACAVLVPSRKEGFGLTALEAMSAGTPALISDTDALREVCADAAVVLPVDDPGPWAETIDALGDDPALRREWGERGVERARHFSWQATARATRRVYLTVADEVTAA